MVDVEELWHEARGGVALLCGEDGVAEPLVAARQDLGNERAVSR
jgi:hypothetical protein